MINGTGELWTFSAEPDSTLKRYRVEQEIYQEWPASPQRTGRRQNRGKVAAIDFAQAIITLMQTPEDADFPVILDILKSTEEASKSSNGNHILKWVLRFASQLPLPPPGSGDEDPVSVNRKRMP